MAYKSNDGSEWTNAAHAQKQNLRSEDAKTAKSTKAKPAAEAETDTESQEPSAVVAEHGPATQVLITHEGGKHTVKSKHKGHTHTSEHASAEDAHAVGKQLAGADENAAPESEMDEMHGNPAAAMMG